MVTVSWLPSGLFGECRPLIEVNGPTPARTQRRSIRLPATRILREPRRRSGRDRIRDVDRDYLRGRGRPVCRGGRSIFRHRSWNAEGQLHPRIRADGDLVVEHFLAVNFCQPAVSVTGFAPAPYSVTIGSSTFGNVLIVGENGMGAGRRRSSPSPRQILFATVDSVQSASTVVAC